MADGKLSREKNSTREAGKEKEHFTQLRTHHFHNHKNKGNFKFSAKETLVFYGSRQGFVSLFLSYIFFYFRIRLFFISFLGEFEDKVKNASK